MTTTTMGWMGARDGVVERKGWRAAALLFCGLLVAAAPAPTMPQQVSGDGGARRMAPVVRATQVTGAVVVDGRLDEAEWQAAVPANGFVQLEPDEGRPATEATEVRILVDDEAVYVGALLSDGHPEGIVARLGRRDDDVQADWFYAWFDGYHDRRTALGFGVSAAGVQRDLRVANDDDRDASWDAVWDAATRQTPDGWVVEMRIPLSQIRFTQGSSDGWGVNFTRTVARKNETSHWSPMQRNAPEFVSRFGDLEGVSTLSPRRRIEILPYAVARLTRQDTPDAHPFRSDLARSASIGADVRVGLGSALTLSATLNPDFGQVEADPAVLNLTAFETFQQERRPFFVEGADIFGLAFPTWPPMFYSRRIGRSPQAPSPSNAAYTDRPSTTTILGALKLTGKTQGGWSIGLLDAVTSSETTRFVDAEGRPGEAAAEPLTHYAAARVAREFREGQSGIGVLATSVNRELGEDRSLAFLHENAFGLALDGYHRFGGGDWETRVGLQGSMVRGDTAAIRRTQMAPGHYYQRPDAEHLELDPSRTSLTGWSATAAIRKVGGAWKTGVYGHATSPGFEVADLGFNPTLDQVNANTWLRYEQYERGSLFRNWGLGASMMVQSDTDGLLKEFTQDAGFNFRLLNYWGGNVWVMRHAPAWTTTLLRGGPALSKPGRWMGSFRVHSDERRTMSGNASLSWEAEDETAGNDLTVSANVTVRPSERVTLEVGPRVNLGRDDWQFVGVRDVTGADRFMVGGLHRKTLSLSTRLDYTLSPTLSLQTYVRPFVATVEYDAFREVADPGARAFDDRFADHRVERVVRDGADLLRVDRDGDGGADFEMNDPSFTTASVQMNTVVRWEYRPGSTLYAVWTHDRDAFGRDRFALEDNLDALWRAPARNVFMLKASWWVGR